MNLNLNPENVQWPVTHFVFVEKIGPFQNTARQAWELARSKKSEISAKNGFEYGNFIGGAYAKFVLTGSYSNLPEACGQVFSQLEKLKIQVRDDFFIENYVNDPSTTQENHLITEILIPKKV